MATNSGVRNTVLRLVLAAAVSGFAGRAAAQNLDSVRITTERLGPGMYVLFGAGGNIGLAVGPDAVFVVDDQFAPLTPKILAAIAAITDQPVRFVVNTHWHFDHSGGNENMGKAGALIVAHDNVRRRMSAGQFIEGLKREPLPSRQEPPAPRGALPVVTFGDGLTWHLNGGEIRAIHLVPAHTDGDAAVYFLNANVLHTGDVFVRYGFPFIDLTSGGSLGGMVQAVDAMLAVTNDSTKLIPGHGPIASRADLRAYREMLATIHDRVRKQVEAGATLDRILESKPTRDFDGQWGQGPIKGDDFVRFAYLGLKGR